MKISPYVSAVLVPLMVGYSANAQTVAAPAENQIELHLIGSDGPRVPAGAHTGKGIAVEVVDLSGHPVADAAVALRFPEDGATAFFKDGSHSAVAYTDAAGRTTIKDFQYANLAGPIALRVTASKGNAHAGLMVEQSAISTVASEPVHTHAVTIPASGTNATLGTSADSPAAEPDEVVLASSTETPQAAAPRPLPVPTTQISSVSTAPVLPANSTAVNAAPEATLLAENTSSSAPPPMPGMLPKPGHLTIAPAISITSPDKYATYHRPFGAKKWIILGLIAGAGVGAALALGGGSSKATTPSSSGLSVGAPTISIGHP